ncbi:MAG: hypothetical protein AB7K09_01545 [Planctomycetota bacterium]
MTTDRTGTRLRIALAALLLWASASLAQDPVAPVAPVAPDDSARGAASAVEAADAALAALAAGKRDAFRLLVTDEALAGPGASLDAILEVLRVQSAQRETDKPVPATHDGTRATAIYRLRATLDIGDLTELLLRETTRDVQASGGSREDLARALEMVRAVMNATGPELRKAVTHIRHRMTLQRVGDRWFVRQLLDPIDEEKTDNNRDGLQDGDEEPGEAGGGATPEDAAKRVIAAWQARNMDELRLATRPGDFRDTMDAVDADPAFAAALTIESCRYGNVWRDGHRAWVQYQWQVTFDAAAYRAHRLSRLEAKATADGKSEMVVRMLKAALNDELDHFIGELVHPAHIMAVERHDDSRWYAVNQPFCDQKPALDARYNVDGIVVDDHRAVTDPGYSPPESECGGATPEALARRVITAWQTDNMIDVVWTSRPSARPWYRQQDRRLVVCIKVQSFELDVVWERGDSAWVRFNWRARLDDTSFARFQRETIERQVQSGELPAAQGIEQIRTLADTVRNLKADVEEPTHIMRVAKVGDRWYLAGPFEDHDPGFPPTRKADGEALPQPDDKGDDDNGGDNGSAGGQDGDSDKDGNGLQDGTPAENTCGGGTPEAAVKRVLAAWKAHNTDDLVWCAKPDNREAAKKSDAILVVCVTITEMKLKKVWIKGDTAWVSWSWHATFDDNRYYQHHVVDLVKRAKEAGAKEEHLEQARNLFRQSVLRTKKEVESSDHVTQLELVNGRWYAPPGKPYQDVKPAGPATRDAAE